MNKLVVIGVLLLALVSCRNRKELNDLPKKSNNELSDCVQSSIIEPEWFSAKIATDFKAGDKEESFKINLRMKKDSIIWANIMKGPIVVATIIITPDSVKGAVKIGDNVYFEKDFDFIKRAYGVDLKYDMLEDMFWGNPVGYEPEERYKQLDDSTNYLFSTHSQRQIEKAFEKIPRREEKQYMQRYWFRGEDCKVVQTLINQLADSSSIDIKYLDFKKEKELIVPNRVTMEAFNTRDSVRLEMNYSRHGIDKDLKFPFRVNDKYIKIDPEEL